MSQENGAEPSSVRLFILGEGLADGLEHVTTADRPIAEIVDVVVASTGFAREELLIFREDEDAPLDGDALIEVIKVITVHAHRCKHVHVVVNYNQRHIEREFSPATTIGRVRHWAVGDHGFNLPEGDRPRFELQLPDETVPAEKDHLGQFTRHGECSVTFDLVEGEKPQG